jgi:peptide methionine sulfoxide reductase MsrA
MRMDTRAEREQRATFAAGCFWGVEQVFSEIDGLLRTTARPLWSTFLPL